MKIFQVITLSELGGAQSVLVNIANYLSEEHEIVVLAGGRGEMWELLSPMVKRIPIKSLVRKLSPVNDLITVLIFVWSYWKYKPDVIHLHSSKASILGRLAFPKKKIIYTVHGFDSIRIAYRKYLPVERLLQYRCNAIVGVSCYDKKHLLEEDIIHNVSVVYNGIRKPVSLKCNPFEHLKEYTHKVLCIARLSPQKNSKLFLEIASLLPQYAFIWIGNQSEIREEYTPNVFFWGNLPNAGAYNEHADLFMLTSNYEGLPMSILEAMAFGKPIVASDVGGISEIIANNENGYVIENNSILFSQKIQYLLENQDVYKRFSEKSLVRFQQDLTVDKMVNGYLRIYDKIVE